MELEVQDWIGVAALAVAILALTIMVFRTRGRIRERSESSENFRRDAAEAGSVRRELDQLLVDIEAMCREITAKLDTKMRVINELITQADERIEKLRSINAENQASEPMSTPENAKEDVPAENSMRKVEINNDSGEKSEPEKMIDAPLKDSESIDTDPRFSRIFEMSDAGADIITIAKETGMPKGEIKLVLGLRRRNKKN
ncbi:MAG: DUF6115 domain-containing protein [Planctomycetota bacterium]|jgi:hypothetical protein